MFFQARYYVRHWGIDELSKSSPIETTNTPRIALSLSKLEQSEPVGAPDGSEWLAALSTEEPVSSKVEAQFVAALSAEQKPSDAVLDVVAKVRERMTDFLRRFLCLARWRAGMHGHHELIRLETGVMWSSDRVQWKPARPTISVVMATDVRSVGNADQVFEDITQLLLRHEQAPIAHELLREAWNLKDGSPRSALMLGMSAMEVGVKAFVANLVPESEWLCFEAPMPPVVRILREYLPKLPVRRRINGKASIPDVMLDTLKKATERRNRVAHRGEVVEHDQLLVEILNTIQRVLFLLDYYAGYDWALQNVRDSNFSPMFAADQ